MNTKMTARSFSVMKAVRSSRFSVRPGILWELLVYRKSKKWKRWLELAVLGKGIAGQRFAFRTLRHFEAHSWGIRRRDPGRPQHGILREPFALNRGDQIILDIRSLAPS